VRVQAGVSPARESVPVHSDQSDCESSALSAVRRQAGTDAVEDDGLIVSPSPVKVIELPIRPDAAAPVVVHHDAQPSVGAPTEWDWLSQPLSRRGVEWLINTLALLAAVLLFVLVFLVVTREIPRWPFAMAAGAAVVVAALYWGFFTVFGGASPGARLARLMGYEPEEKEEAGSVRFR